VVTHVHGVWRADFCPNANSFNFYIFTLSDFAHGQGFGHATDEAFDDYATTTLNPGYYGARIYCSGDSGLTSLDDTFVVPSVPSISSDAILPPAIIGQMYSVNVGMDVPIPADSYDWSIVGGSLPNGLSLNPADGVISGVATVASSSTFIIQLRDSLGQVGTKAFSLETATQPMLPSIDTIFLPISNFGASISIPVLASGGVAPYTWSASNFPNGVSIDAHTGNISGIPASTEIVAQATTTFNPTIRIQDSIGQISTRTLSWEIVSGFTFTRIPQGNFVTGPIATHVHGVWRDDFCPNANSFNFYVFTLSDFAHGQGFGHVADENFDDYATTTLNPGYYTARIYCSGASGLTSLNDSFTVPSVPIISSDSVLPPGIIGEHYSVTLAMDVPIAAESYQWSVDGNLPDGMTLNPTSGVLSGIPTSYGTSTFTVQLEDSVGQTDSKVFLLVSGSPSQPLSIDAISLPESIFGQAVSIPVTASGGVAPYVWSAVNLPNGVSVDSSTGGLSGAPATSDIIATTTTYHPTIIIRDSIGSTATSTLTWKIKSEFLYSRSPGSNFVVGPVSTHIKGVWKDDFCPSADSFNFYVFAFADFAHGQATGHTPGSAVDDYATTTLAPGNYAPTIYCSGSPIPASLNFNDNFEVPSIPVISSNSTLPPAITGQTYSVNLQLNVPFPAAPYVWSVSSGSLPSGLSMDSSGHIFGTPMASGVSTFTLHVEDAASQTAIQVATIHVFSPITITTSSLPETTTGTHYLQNIVVANATNPVEWSINTGSLPPGLNLNSSTGSISGTSTSLGSYNFTVQAIDSNSQTTSKELVIKVNVAPVITASTLPDGTVTIPYTQIIAVSGGTYPLSWSIISGALPTGLNINPITAEISGTPTANGTATFTVKVQDSANVNSTQTLSLRINKVTIITTNNLSAGKVGSSYSKTFHASGGTDPLTWSNPSGMLPPGISLNGTGSLTGVPTVATTTSFSVKVTDSNGNSDIDTFNLQIKP
jgi:hypothetical protein